MSTEHVERDLNVRQRIAFSIPQIGVNMSGTIFASWIAFFLAPPDDEVARGHVVLIGAAAFGMIQMWGKVVDAVADPIIGHWSDRTRSRLGRRMPFILYGTPLYVLAYLALWFPPFEPGSVANLIYMVTTFTLYWVVFTAVLGPYSALLPEVTTGSRGRILLSVAMGYMSAVGAIVGMASGVLISAFPGGAVVLGLHINSGIQLAALIGGLSLFLCLTPLINIRETPHSKAKEVSDGVFDSVKSALKNESFLPVVGIAFFFKLGGAMVTTLLPYLTTQLLEGAGSLVADGQGEAWTAYLIAPAILGALLLMPFIHRLAARFGNKRLVAAGGIVYGACLMALPAITLFPEPAVAALVLMTVVAFPTSVMLVMPYVLFAEVIDYDETVTGLRREGIYNGAVAFLTKWADGIGVWLVMMLLTFGNSRSDPAGILIAAPIAGAAVLVGVAAFRRYPEARMREAIAAYRARDAADPGDVDRPTAS